MKERMLIVFIMMMISTTAFAYSLHGSMDYDGDGFYKLNLQNNDGHDYTGVADDHGDGTISVFIHDENGESYSGTALDEGDGNYNLNLINNETGNTAGGHMSERID